MGNGFSELPKVQVECVVISDLVKLLNEAKSPQVTFTGNMDNMREKAHNITIINIARCLIILEEYESGYL